ncbi:MAG: hypothetical protein V2A73_01085 [Pseudomonadota bacterium]
MNESVAFSTKKLCLGHLAVLGFVLHSSLGCSRCSCAGRVPSGGASPAGGIVLPESLQSLEPHYRAAMARARAWLDNLHVDPLELRAVHIKGKKKLVEQLDSYYRLWQVAPQPEKAELLERIRQVVAITFEDRYHDMATISDRWFKQDATSYLRAAVLMERLGLDTTRYREEIRKIHGRLNGHMERRGPHQRRVFHWYYAHFGLAEPFPLDGALEAGVIAQRLDPAKMTNNDVYSLTHEVYAVYEYGDQRDVDPFDTASKAYLRTTIGSLIHRYKAKSDPDLAGELVECLHYLRMQDSPAYLDGVHFLLSSQNQDGSWGSYAHHTERLGKYVNHGFRLHTTLVAIGALTAIFERPMTAV